MSETFGNLDDVLGGLALSPNNQRYLKSIIRKRMLLSLLVGIFEGAGWLYLYLDYTGVFDLWL